MGNFQQFELMGKVVGKQAARYLVWTLRTDDLTSFDLEASAFSIILSNDAVRRAGRNTHQGPIPHQSPKGHMSRTLE
jgi:hypothetical protein